jgi:hypothetical protein
MHKGPALQAFAPASTRLRGMLSQVDVVSAHRELVEASNAVRHLLVIEDLTEDKIAEARSRLERAYRRVTEVDDEVLCV